MPKKKTTSKHTTTTRRKTATRSSTPTKVEDSPPEPTGQKREPVEGAGPTGQ